MFIRPYAPTQAIASGPITPRWGTVYGLARAGDCDPVLILRRVADAAGHLGGHTPQGPLGLGIVKVVHLDLS